MTSCEIEAATGPTLDQTHPSTSRPPSGRNSRWGRGAKIFFKQSLLWAVGLTDEVLRGRHDPARLFAFFPITSYTHSGVSVLPKSIATGVSVSITPRVTTAACERTHAWGPGGGGYCTFHSEAPRRIGATGPVIKLGRL